MANYNELVMLVASSNITISCMVLRHVTRNQSVGKNPKDAGTSRDVRLMVGYKDERRYASRKNASK